MSFDINTLSSQISNYMSSNRYLHTLSVCKMSEYIGLKIMPEKLDELICAALLHDIAKEFSIDRQIQLTKKSGYMLTNTDLSSPAIIHAYAAPGAIKKYFPEYATKDILSATFNHTIGSPDMSIFDEIIFLSDFIEYSRKYEASIITRKHFLDALTNAQKSSEYIVALHKGVVESIDFTLKYILDAGGIANPKTILTRNAIIAKYS